MTFPINSQDGRTDGNFDGATRADSEFKPTVVIAGGTAGVGRAAARAFADRGHPVAVLARGVEPMPGDHGCHSAFDTMARASSLQERIRHSPLEPLARRTSDVGRVVVSRTLRRLM